MSEPVDIDALASAYIDDELDTADRAVVESDPVVMAKVAEYRHLADLLRSPIAIDPATRDRSIAVALGHLAVPASLSPVSEPAPLVRESPSPTRRTRRSWRGNPAGMWAPVGLVAAALIALAIVSLDSSDDGASSSAATLSTDRLASAKADATSQEDTLAASPEATRNAATAITAAGAATTIVASAGGDASSQAASQNVTSAEAANLGLADLGSVSSAAELGSRLAGGTFSGGASGATSPPITSAVSASTSSTLAGPVGPSSVTTCPGLGSPVAVATLDGIEVVVYEDARGGFVIADVGCGQLSRLDAGGAVTP